MTKDRKNACSYIVNVSGLLYLYVWKSLLLFCAFEHESADMVINWVYSFALLQTGVQGRGRCGLYIFPLNNVIHDMEYVKICIVHYYWFS